VNAVWDLWAKAERKPVWKLLVDMTPAEVVRCIDFRYITDAITPDEALAILKRLESTKAQREAEMGHDGFPAYTTSAGWLGYSDEKIRALCRQAVNEGWTHVKIKVGRDLEDDLRRAEEWLGAILGERLAEHDVPPRLARKIRLIDATCISCRGSKTTERRVHLTLDLGTNRTTSIELTDRGGGESLERFSLRAGEIVIVVRAMAAFSRVELVQFGIGDAHWQPVQTAAGIDQQKLAVARPVRSFDHLVDRRTSVESPRDGGRDGGGAVLAEGDVGNMHQARDLLGLRGGGARVAGVDDADRSDGHGRARGM